MPYLTNQLPDLMMTYYRRYAKERKKKVNIVVTGDGRIFCMHCKAHTSIFNINPEIIDNPFMLEHMHSFGEIRQIMRNRRFKQAARGR